VRGITPLTKTAEKLHIQGAMLSNVGLHRARNEDTVVFVIPRQDEPAFAKGALALVADGMGGHAAGEVASSIASEVIVQTFYEHAGPPPAALSVGFAEANHIIFNQAQSRPDWSGMGTTCTAVVFADGQLYLGHVGDSRAYLLRGGLLSQLSEDQSLVMEMVRNGSISQAEAARHPDRNVILQSLGTRQSMSAIIWHEGLVLQANERVLLCTDGLTDCVTEQTIREILLEHPLQSATEALIRAALDAGASDNVSAGVFSIGCEEPQPKSEVRKTRRIKVRDVP